MKRWDGDEYVEVPHVDAFLAEMRALCEKHKLSITHEDKHGAFIVTPFSEDDVDDLESAHWWAEE